VLTAASVDPTQHLPELTNFMMQILYPGLRYFSISSAENIFATTSGPDFNVISNQNISRLEMSIVNIKSKPLCATFAGLSTRSGSSGTVRKIVIYVM